MSAALLALLERDSAAGILAAADHLSAEASRVSLGGGSFAGRTSADGARLVEWMLATVRRWRGVVERHGRYKTETVGAGWCREHYKPLRYAQCPDLTETADEARTYASGAA